jgi:4-amino-4-deoxy-L-arabinose transferase-like glycosyltransferase
MMLLDFVVRFLAGSPDNDSKAHDLARGVVGVSVPVGAVTLSAMQEVELWLRISSLAIGIVVGFLTALSLAISIVRKVNETK